MTCDPASPRHPAPGFRASWGATALLLGSTTTAQAGALDRTLQPVGVVFEKGSYAELSYGVTSPEVSGTLPGTDTGSGNVGVDFSSLTLSFKYDVTSRVAVVVVQLLARPTDPTPLLGMPPWLGRVTRCT